MALVLVVDDEPGMCLMLRRFFERDGLDVVAAGDAGEALEALAEKPVDVVVSDVIMPKIDGLDLLRRIRQGHPSLPVILMTAKPTKENALAAAQAGAFEYLSKPVLREDICKTVHKAVQLKRLNDENRLYRRHLVQSLEEQSQEAQRSKTRLQRLAEGVNQFSISRNRRELGERLLHLLKEDTTAQGGSLYLFEKGKLELAASLDGDHQRATIDLPPEPRSIIGRLLAKKEALLVIDIAAGEAFKPSGWNGYRNGSVLALPIEDQTGEVRGVITLHDKLKPPFSEQDLEFGRLVAAHGRAAIENLELGKSLKGEEEKSQFLLDSSPTGIAIQQDGAFVYANPRFYRLLDRRPEDLPAVAPLDLFHPDDRLLAAARLAEAGTKEGEPVSFEARLLCGDGRAIWTETTVSRMEHDGRPALICNHIDISKRKHAEEAAAEAECERRLVLDSISELVEYVDASLTIRWTNRAVLDYFGRLPGEVVGKHCYELWRGRSEPCEKCAVRAALETEAPSGSEFATPDGREWQIAVYPVRERGGRIVGAVEVARDVTLPKRMQRELADSEERLRAMTGAARDPIIAMDDAGRISFWNEAARQTFGWAAEEALGQNLHDFLAPPEFAEKYRPGLAHFHSTGEGPVIDRTVALTGRKKDGTAFPIELSLSRARIKNEWSAVGIVRDISERKRAENEKRQLEAQLLQSQKMEAVGRLAGGVAHDFNNLLTGITGNLQLVLMDIAPQGQQYELLSEVQAAADRAAELTQQLLTFSRKQVIEPQVIDLNQVITRLEKMLRRLIGEDVQLAVLPGRDVETVRIDLGQIEQVLVNLAVNARDAMPDGGRLAIETAMTELDEEYCHLRPYCTPGRYVRLSVSDTGLGMAEDVRLRIFEPFFTTKPQGKGTGLGLSLVYGIVKQNYGSIEVYSEPGYGTTFKIYLPVASCERRAEPVRPPLEETVGGTETVLVAEDDAVVRELVVRTLRRLGYTVLAAVRGDDGA